MFHCCWLHGWLIGSICCGRMRRVTLLTGRISFQLFLLEQASQPHPSQQAWGQKHWKACPHLVVWTSDADVGGQNSMLRWSQWLFNWDSAMWSGGEAHTSFKKPPGQWKYALICSQVDQNRKSSAKAHQNMHLLYLHICQICRQIYIKNISIM